MVRRPTDPQLLYDDRLPTVVQPDAHVTASLHDGHATAVQPDGHVAVARPDGQVTAARLDAPSSLGPDASPELPPTPSGAASLPGRDRWASLPMLRAAVQVVASVALGALLLALLAGALPSFFGLDAFVLGHDVSSALRAGDLVVASPAHPGQLSVGDVVSYRTPDRPDVLVTRRLVGIAADERGQVTLQTGDRQTGQLDEVAVEPGAVVARLVYAVPWIGFVVDLAKRPEGKVVLIVLPGVLLAVDALLRARAQRHGSVAVSEAEPAAVPGPAPLAPETFDPGVAPADRTAADLLLRQAWVLVRRSATAEATPLLDRALALDPYCASAWLLKAECLTDPWDRRACLQAGLTIDPGAAELRQALEEAPRWDLAS